MILLFARAARRAAAQPPVRDKDDCVFFSVGRGRNPGVDAVTAGLGTGTRYWGGARSTARGGLPWAGRGRENDPAGTRPDESLPFNGKIIFQKFSTPVFARINAVKKRVTDPCGAVDDIQGRLKIMKLLLQSG